MVCTQLQFCSPVRCVFSLFAAACILIDPASLAACSSHATGADSPKAPKIPKADVSPISASDDLSAALAKIAAKNKVPALAAMVVDGRGTILRQGVTGVRANTAVEANRTLATIDDLWHLGSCTKAMTGTLCGVLVGQGKLRWTSTLGEVLGTKLPAVAGLPEAPMDPQWQAVTLEQLLVHRAGAPDGLDENGLWGRLWNHTGTPTESRQLLATGLLSRAPKHAPGSKFEYSNAGTALAGFMAETVMATPFEVLIQRELFAPIGITSAGFGAPGQATRLAADKADRKPDQPRGHTADGKPVRPGPSGDNPPGITPAGRVHMSIGDWAKFAALHVRGEAEGWKNPDGSWRLKPEDFVKLHEPKRDGDKADGANAYAMGWAILDRKDSARPLLQHAGSNTLWLCQVIVDRDGDKAYLVCCNVGGPGAEKAIRQATTLLRR